MADGAYTFWGKLDASSQPARTHPLRDHCLDVALTLNELVRTPGVARALKAATPTSLVPAHFERLAVIALLHDIGKCNHGFQAKAGPDARATAGHVLEAVALLLEDKIKERWPAAFSDLLGVMCDWFAGADEQLVSMLLASISHHGRPVAYRDLLGSSDRNLARWWTSTTQFDPMQGVSELTQLVRVEFPAAFSMHAEPIAGTPAFQQRFAGLVMLADWIASDTQFFPYRDGPAENRTELARAAAQRAISAIGLTPPHTRSARTFAQTFGFEPTPLQSLLGETLPIDEDSALVLAESDTGSGKTEAALAWFLRLYREERVDGLYFALPTRVAARELYERVHRAMDSAFPDPAARPAPVLLAAPGYVRIDGHSPLLPDPAGRIWEDDETSRRHERQWAAEHPKRFLAAPVAVGTIDQALLSVLKVKHSLLRSVCLDRNLVVVDEVHASDPYMRTLLHCLLEGHIKRGGHALLLSATLGESACSTLFNRSLATLAQAEARPYPAVTTRHRQRPVARTGAGKRVAVDMLDSLEVAPLLPRIMPALTAGARVLVVCNTVARANAVIRAVEADGRIPRSAMFSVCGVTCPHHGRFAREHREVLDAEVGRRLGKDSAPGPFLIVGTQTLEQSLDIDADWLVTDLCPMDVLLQRIGRLHRHRRPSRPPGFEAPRVLLRIPGGADLTQWLQRDGIFRGPAGLGTVYPDGRVLQRTLDVLRAGPEFELPRDNRQLVEQTTHPEAWCRLPEAWRPHARDVDGRQMAQVQAALTGTVTETPFGELQYSAPEERVATRLGAGNLDLPLAHPMSQPFDILVRSIGIPAHMAPKATSLAERIDATICEDGFRFTLGERQYRYTRFGLEIDSG